MATREQRVPALVPSPRTMRLLPGRFSLQEGVPIVLPPAASDLDFATARALQVELRETCGLLAPIEGHARQSDLGPRIALSRSEARGRLGDGYSLRVEPECVAAVGAGPAGLRYAIETLAQLFDARGRARACAVDDTPCFELRGVMLDVSRGKVPTLETLRGVVDQCVRLKLNVLMLYTEHTFQFRRHPEIGADASPMDAETLRELDRYGAECFVQLVPSLQSLGHMDHILSLRSYQHLAETERRWTIAPEEPGTLELLRDMYEEYLPNFRSSLFNANCDEPTDLGKGKSAKRDKKLGPGGLYLEHVRRLRDLAAEGGKRTLIWGDVVHNHPERIAEIDRDLVLLDWWYEARFDFERVRVFADNGLEFMVCPGTSTWNSLFPRIDNSLGNITGWANAGRRYGALGLLNTDWGDYGHYNLQGNSWFGYAWGAQESWSGDAPSRSFDRAFSRRVFGDPTGEIARIYRALGGIHDPGFSVANGSALQYLFFDDVTDAWFVSGAKPAALARCERALTRVRDRIEAARPRFARESLTCDELAWAADASLHAVRKAREGLAYLAWRRRPDGLNVAARRKLSRSLAALADEQRLLGRELRRLWLARSHPSNYELTGRRLARAVKSLRAAVRALEGNSPPPPPEDHEGFAPSAVARAMRRSLAG